MIFANPTVLLLLILIPVIVLLAFTKANQSDLNIAIAGQEKSFASITDKIGFYLPFILRIFCLSVLIIALARPQKGESFTTSKNLGIDIMTAVDTSQSMSALDLTLDNKPTDRLTVVKHILKEFVSKRTSDRLGLLVFGEKAYVQCPLTTDQGAIIDLIDHIRIGMVGDSTAIGSAIAVAVKRLKDLKAKSRIFILLTDGQNTSGNITPIAAAEMAKEFDIKIYTIGVGKNGEVPFLVDTPLGPRVIKQIMNIDEDTLDQIAQITGGKYFRAETTQDLKKIYEHIDKLEKSEIEVKEHSSYKDVYEGLLWTAFALFVAELSLGNTVLFRIT